MKTKWSLQKEFCDTAISSLLWLIAWPYYLMYGTNTREPILQFARASSGDQVAEEVTKWLQTKRNEANYIQAAGAVTFASVIGTLSWPSIEGRHWLGPACWYSSLVLSIGSIVLAAQQTMLVSHLKPLSKPKCFGKEFWGEGRPRWALIFAWQAPLMMLSYALVLYFVGLATHVVSPVIRKGLFDDDAKALILFGIFFVTCFIVYAVTSILVHGTVAPAEKK